jgi:hypothetical protein
MSNAYVVLRKHGIVMEFVACFEGTPQGAAKANQIVALCNDGTLFVKNVNVEG